MKFNIENKPPEVDGHVKINRSGEKFWVEVIFIDNINKMITGTVDNDMIKTKYHGLKYLDVISFHFNEVLDVLLKNEY